MYAAGWNLLLFGKEGETDKTNEKINFPKERGGKGRMGGKFSFLPRTNPTKKARKSPTFLQLYPSLSLLNYSSVSFFSPE